MAFWTYMDLILVQRGEIEFIAQRQSHGMVASHPVISRWSREPRVVVRG